jgi:hypothetical protein
MADDARAAKRHRIDDAGGRSGTTVRAAVGNDRLPSARARRPHASNSPSHRRARHQTAERPRDDLISIELPGPHDTAIATHIDRNPGGGALSFALRWMSKATADISERSRNLGHRLITIADIVRRRLLDMCATRQWSPAMSPRTTPSDQISVR